MEGEVNNQFEEYYFLEDAFKDPINFVPPNYDNLSNNLTQPQFNSENYRMEKSHYQVPKTFLNNYTALDINSEGLILIASNSYNTFIYNGVLGLTSKFDNIVNNQVDNIKFLKQMNNISNVRFIEQSKFIISTSNNKLSLNYSDVDISSGAQAIIQFSSLQTNGKITSFDKFQDSSIIVAGTSKGHLDLFEIDSYELMQHSSHIEYGHLSAVNGISSHISKNKCWVSVSDDKNCIMWDRSVPTSQSSLFLMKNYKNGFGDVNWISDNVILSGDYGGNLIVLDPRKPSSIVHEEKVSNRSISQIKVSNNSSKKIGVVSDTTVVKIFNLDTEGKLKLLHEHNANNKLLYSMAWDAKNDKKYYVVGEEKYAKEITI